MKYALKGKYPIETKDQLEKTAKYFDRYLSRFHPMDRVAFATAIEKRASELRADIDYSKAEALTTYGRIGVKVWIYRGEVLPEVEERLESTEGVYVSE